MSDDSGASNDSARPPGPNEGTVSVAAQVGAVALLVVLGFFLKGLVLNWIVGPLFVLFVLVVIPRGFGWIRTRLSGAAAP